MPRSLRSQSGLVGWLQQSSRGVFALDARRRFRFFNSGIEKLTGCHPQDVLGKAAEYRTDTTGSLAERVISALAPPPEVFAAGECITEVILIDSSGHSHQLPVLFLSCQDENGEVLSVFGFVLDHPLTATDLPRPSTNQLHTELARLLAEQESNLNSQQIIASSPAMKRLLVQLKAVMDTRIPFCLHGPRGVGKQFFARMACRSRSHTFLPVMIDCQATPRLELKRILTDQLNVEEAHSPQNCYLRHAECLPADFQALLVNELTNRPAEKQLRVIAGFNQPPHQLREQEILTDEFYLWITHMVLEVPRIRERNEDFELLGQCFLEAENRGREVQLSGLDSKTWNLLKSYSWPGEVAEFQAVIQEACRNCETALVKVEHLPYRFQSGMGRDAIPPAIPVSLRPLEESLLELERTLIEQALEVSSGNKAQAAELLGLTRARFYRRMEAVGLDASDKASPEN
ncbi:MAG: sigma 54-interacting transcriptional regulator [Planctomycetaceae bacterium]|nr:sigma 54-interacting transcriptional regulator [Planctomycetaceae bacterium]